MRHKSWQWILDAALPAIAERHGTSIRDQQGKAWDPGQAICVEAYGRDWMSSPEFRKCDETPSEEPAPPEFVAAARRLMASTPAWIAQPQPAKT